MLLVWLLAAFQSPVANPPHDLTSYLAIAARFRSVDHSAAMGEILSWTLPEIEEAAAALRRQGRRLRAVHAAPGDIDFRTVEAAVLLHAEAGLLSLQAASVSEGQAHLRISVELLDFSRAAAEEQRRKGHAITVRIDRRDFDMALAAASLRLGFPATACFFAEDARRRAPLDAEVHLASVDALLALDMSGSVRGPKLDAVRSAARAFLDGLRAGESAALLAFSEEIRLLEPFTPDLGHLHRAMADVRPGGSTALCDAVYAALRLREPGPRRTAIVVFSDGMDNLSWLTASQVVEAASRSDAIVYAVTVRDQGESESSFPRDVVRATGGQLFEASNERDLPARFLDVLADIRSRYVLSYAVEAADVPGWHALEVRLRRGKGAVLARPGYWHYAPAP